MARLPRGRARRGLHLLRLAQRRRPHLRRGRTGLRRHRPPARRGHPGRAARHPARDPGRRRCAGRLGDRRLRRRRLARARDLRDVRHRLRRLRRRQRPADPAAAAARRVRGHAAAQVVPARRARLQAVARRQGARRGPRVARSRRAAAACRRRACPRPSGARDERARGDRAGAVGARGLPRAAAARRADRAQGDGPHAGPARPDVRRRLPRLGAAGRRRREVRAEGGHHPAGRRPVGLPARPRGGADPVPRRARRPSRSPRAWPRSTCRARSCSCSRRPRWAPWAP